MRGEGGRERVRERGRGAAWLGVREYYLIYYLFILLFIKSTVKYQPCKMEIHGKILIYVMIHGMNSDIHTTVVYI